MPRYMLSCTRFSVLLVTDSAEMITEAAPVIRSWVGQSRLELEKWCQEKFGFVEVWLLRGERDGGKPVLIKRGREGYESEVFSPASNRRVPARHAKASRGQGSRDAGLSTGEE